jgi:hypothetical protein
MMEELWNQGLPEPVWKKQNGIPRNQPLDCRYLPNSLSGKPLGCQDAQWLRVCRIGPIVRVPDHLFFEEWMLHLSSPWPGGRTEVTEEDESQERDLRWSVRVSGITPSDLARHLELNVSGIGYHLGRADIFTRE